MKRYFQCRIRRSSQKTTEFVNGTPVEILSPINQFERALPEEKEKLQVFDFELVEQIHLLEAEYNKNFQDAKYCIAKDDMAKGLHFMSRSREIKKRIDKLEKRHHEVMKKLEEILINNDSYQKYVHPQKTHKIRPILKITPTLR